MELPCGSAAAAAGPFIVAQICAHVGLPLLLLVLEGLLHDRSAAAGAMGPVCADSVDVGLLSLLLQDCEELLLFQWSHSMSSRLAPVLSEDADPELASCEASCLYAAWKCWCSFKAAWCANSAPPWPSYTPKKVRGCC
jgi:hypothetical protein